MEKGNTYVYFALTGDNFDPQIVSERIGIVATEMWKKGDKGKYKPVLQHSRWELSTDIGKEYIWVDRLVDEIIEQLFDKIDIINELKNQFNLESVLEIVMYIDTNDEQSTPALGHDLKTIEFLYRTGTKTDVDIYRFNSALRERQNDGVKHEVWQNEEGLTTLCMADERGDGCRKLLEPGSKLIHEFYANSHFEAMTIYYRFMDWGTYTTDFEIDKTPYDKKNT